MAELSRRERKVRIGKALVIDPQFVRHVGQWPQNDRMITTIRMYQGGRHKRLNLEPWITIGDARRMLAREITYEELRASRRMDDVPTIVPPDYAEAYRVEVGGGFYRLLTYADGTVRFEHVCNRRSRGLIICAPKLQLNDDHLLTYDDQGRPTVTPSILCEDCGTHGWIQAGVWTNA